MLAHVAQLDQALSEAVARLRWGPLTSLFLVASMWWVKGVLIAALGAVGDLHARRWPRTALAAATAMGAASLVAASVKGMFDRARPPVADPGFHALVRLPHSSSFPSGHASTAFAAATVVALLQPRLRVPALAVATLVAVSRVYLGVHFTSDVVAGAVLGALIGAAVVWLVRRAERPLALLTTLGRRAARAEP
jgi:membrane-associated phospholipid phosphatase